MAATMTVLHLVGDFNDPSIECGSCWISFKLYWQRDAVTKSIAYCPFCGEEVEDTVDDMDKQNEDEK
jgi:hypothetical protein